MQKIPLSKCFVNPEVEEAALRALRSGQYILGKECQAFEAELAAHTGAQHCVLGSSWTLIVYMLHLAQGLKAGDEVIVPSHTAFPTMEPLIHCGATPVFADIDDTFCMDPAHVETLITPRTVGIIPVHLYGHPADLERIFAIAAKHKLWVLEDCAQAHGARHKDKRVGSMGFAGAYSFFPSKNLTVLGDGGCICTNDTALAEQVRRYRNHGRKDKYLPRIRRLQRALQRNPRRDRTRHAQASRRLQRQSPRHCRALQPAPGRHCQDAAGTPWAKAVYHMYVVRAERRDELQKFLKENNIETGIHYPVPNHQQPAITNRFRNVKPLPKHRAGCQRDFVPAHPRRNEPGGGRFGLRQPSPSSTGSRESDDDARKNSV